MIETLLNTLEAERYFRGALLLTIADALRIEGLDAAAHVAEALLERVAAHRISEPEFADELRTLRIVVQTLEATRTPTATVAAA